MLSFGRHKGSGLAVMCEIMAGAIGGGQRVDQPTKGGILNSMLATVIDLSRLGDPDAMAREHGGDQELYPQLAPAPGFDEVLLPGEPERRAAQERSAAGIPVDATTWQDVQEAATKLGITDAEIARAVGLN